MNTQEKLKTNSQQTKREWTAIDIRFEYPGFQGKEKWIIATNLSEQKLLAKYPEIKKNYEPYVLVSQKFLEARNDYKANELFHYRFSASHLDQYSSDDEISALFHKELRYIDKEFDYVDDEINYMKARAEKEKREDDAIAMVKEGMELLTPIQKRRLKAVFFEGKSSRKVAQEEGVQYSKIDNSIAQALKKLKIFLETGGAFLDF